MTKAGDRQSTDETLGKLCEVLFSVSLLPLHLLCMNTLNAELVSSPVVEVSCFLLRLLFYYLLHTTVFNLSI